MNAEVFDQQRRRIADSNEQNCSPRFQPVEKFGSCRKIWFEKYKF